MNSLGKQRTKILSRKAKELYEKMPERFSKDFDQNKRALDELGVSAGSTVNRNIMAGFIVRLADKPEL